MYITYVISKLQVILYFKNSLVIDDSICCLLSLAILCLLNEVGDTGSTGHITFLPDGRRSGYVVGVFGLEGTDFHQVRPSIVYCVCFIVIKYCNMTCYNKNKLILNLGLEGNALKYIDILKVVQFNTVANNNCIHVSNSEV